MGWKRNGGMLALAAALLGGGYLCTIGAYDHTRPPPEERVATGAAPASPAASAPRCVRDPIDGISCVEEMVVVAPRRAPAAAVLASSLADGARAPAATPVAKER